MIGERFTREARQAVRDAVVEAQRAHANEIGPEHLLLALLDAPVLASFDVPRSVLEADLREARRKGGLSEADAEALKGLGIDVDQIVASVERSLGEGALAAEPPAKRRLFRLPFNAAAKKTLERSLVEARELGHRTLGREHLVLALLSGRGLVAEVLGARGVSYPEAWKRVANSPR
ncbi:ATP-dependent Clp protease ATP-binding subunit ClpA [Saccharothrix tamanrassetensis]|uniref:ATP-dependent Clp protease ATP-binding subunit ClpA n=1 Tax=Saccharothrix tamanrassetensis TaxID=1051531 RepID=A0A841CF63_9PSEU|nr:Clp protease N-terminal domain-containing protein [Saccharothrix tamanrassetensis]MBB5954655.1 ATP-dependent Clp protease ATP-binding subunit ClpA [Saccharothrix tamanrassetensis]